MSIDLSVEICGVKFPNPITPGAGDLASTVDGCKELIEAGVGAICTKTLTPLQAPRSRPRPYNFAIHGKLYEQAGCLTSVTSNWPEHIDIVLKTKIPEFKRLCRAAGIPLVVSWWGPIDMENGKLKDGIREAWIDIAQKVDAAGADLQELNIANPFVASAIVLHPTIGFELVKAVCSSGFRAGVKIQPSWEPLEYLAEGWANAGAKFITAHAVVTPGLFVDVEREMPRYAPAIGGYTPGRLFLPWGLGRVARIKKKVNIPVFGLGGVYTAEDALQYILCGASLVQLHTAVYFQGSRIFRKVIQGIEAWMGQKGYTSLDDFRGKVLPMVMSWGDIKSRAEHPYVVPPETPYAPVVDSDRCSSCGVCERACSFRVYRLEEKKLIVDESKCDNCGFCVTVCPKEAIKLVDKNNRARVIYAPTDLMPEPFMNMINDIVRHR